MKFELDTSALTNVFSGSDIARLRGKSAYALQHAQSILKGDDPSSVRFRLSDWVDDPPIGGSVDWNTSPGINIISFRINIELNPSTFNMQAASHQNLLSLAIHHESNHNARFRKRNAPVGLGDDLVNEGLAVNFEEETGHPIDVRRIVLNDALFYAGNQAQPCLHWDTEPQKKDTGLYHDPSDHNKTLYVHTYSLGYALVKGWLSYAGETAASAYAVPAQDVLRPWIDGKYDIDISPPQSSGKTIENSARPSPRIYSDRRLKTAKHY